MPVLLALLSSVSWGAADFLGGTLSRRLPVLLVVTVSQLIAGIVVSISALLLGEFGAAPDYLPWAIAAGLVGAASLAAFYAALAGGTMGVVAPIAALGAVVPVVIGLAAGERPAVVQLLGIVVAVVGVVLASGPELSGASGARPVLLAALAAVGFGSTLVLMAKASETSPVMTAVAMRGASVPLLVLVLVASVAVGRRHGGRLRPPLRPAARDLPLLAVAGLGDLGANLLFNVASTGDLVSIVAVLASLYPVVTVLLARIVHGERLVPIQNAGVALALAGVALITAG